MLTMYMCELLHLVFLLPNSPVPWLTVGPEHPLIGEFGSYLPSGQGWGLVVRVGSKLAQLSQTHGAETIPREWAERKIEWKGEGQEEI